MGAVSAEVVVDHHVLETRARLALALRAAGLKQQAVEEQLLALHPQSAIPTGMESLGADRAAAILAVSGDIAGN